VGYFPIGSTVTVTENLNHNPGQPGEFIDTTGEGPVVIANGFNTVTITNTARGLLEVCKARIAYLAATTPQPTFQFRIDGGAIFNVRAGTCSMPKRVSVGNHTVTEGASNDYDLVAIFVTPSGRTVSTSTATRTAVVSVPYGGNETAVTFVNVPKVGSVKVCKHIPIESVDSLSGKDYTFNMNVQNPAAPGGFFAIPVTVHIDANTQDGCSDFVLQNYPVIQPDGTNTIIGVSEAPGPYVVDDITLTGTRGYCSGTAPAPGPYPGAFCIPTGKDVANRNVNFFLGPGPQFPTFFQHAT
jgi:hypothetical protein